MTKLTDSQIEDVKRRNPCDKVAGRWVRLRRHGKGYIGPCPLHSPDPQAADSTAFECNADGWVCARCEDGGDVIKLVQLREKVSFAAAIDILGGAAAPLDPEAEKCAQAERDQKRAQHDAENELYRQRERDRARQLAQHGRELTPDSDGARYLRENRGVDFPPDVRLRWDPHARFYVPASPKPRLIHTGPALLALIVRRGKFHGLHSTFIDLAQPKGKAVLIDPKTKVQLDAKKMRGSKKGGHIPLVDPPEPHTLVIGEGGEKVLGAWTAFHLTARALEGVAFWSAGDVGNLGGPAAGTEPHPSLKTAGNRPVRVASAEPKMDAIAIEIPDSVTRIYIIGDSTSDRFATERHVARAAARWDRPGREILAVWSPPDDDLDDLFKKSVGEAGRLDAARAIMALFDGALPPSLSPPAGASAPPDQAPSSRSSRARTSFDGGSNSQSSQTGAPAKKTVGQGGGGGNGPSGPQPGPDEDPHQLNLRLAFFPQTDLGNAERFRERNRRRLLYCEALAGGSRSDGGWLWWDGKRWSATGAQQKVRIAEHDCVRGIQLEADACLKEAERLGKKYDGAEAVAKKLRKAAEKTKPAKGKPKIAAVDGELVGDFAGDEAEAKAKKKDADLKKYGAKIFSLWMLGQKLKGWGRQSEANSKLSPIARHASAYLAIEHNQLDTDLFAFNVDNGTLVFRRGWDSDADPSILGHESWQARGDYIKFKPHDPADLITRISPAAFDPQAACPKFLTFLQEVQPEDAMRVFLQDWKGYSLTGDTGAARVVFFLGGGRNGKGVFETATGYAQGEYTASTSVETFMAETRSKSASAPTPELAKLPGIRALRTSEPPKGARLDEGLIKQVTGGDPLDARHLNRPFFTFIPQFKMTMSGNHEPRIGGGDEGIWSRVTYVPWPIFIAEDRRDATLGKKLEAEASGILNWMLDGLARWMEQGLVLPETVKKATADYRRASDQLGRYLEDCCEVAPAGTPEDDKTWRMQSSVALAVHNAWARAGGGSEWKQRGFTDALRDRGFKQLKSNGMYFVGVRLTKDVHDFDGDGRHPNAPNARGGRDDDDIVDL